MAALARAAGRGRAAAPCLRVPCGPRQCRAPDGGAFPWPRGWPRVGWRVLMWQRARRCPRAPGDGRRATPGGDSLQGRLPWTPAVG